MKQNDEARDEMIKEVMTMRKIYGKDNLTLMIVLLVGAVEVAKDLGLHEAVFYSAVHKATETYKDRKTV